MKIMVMVLVGFIIVEILLAFRWALSSRRIISVLAATSYITLCWFAKVNIQSSFIFGLLILVGMFHLINFARVFYGRTKANHLLRVYRQAALWLSLASITLVTTSFWSKSGFNKQLFIPLQIVVAALIFFTTLYSVLKARVPKTITAYSDKELPTVSVCIPARNETEELERCLTSLLATTYPKLEILVLDDCSTDSTSDIIKNFAQHGVRFIKGTLPTEEWLPKNKAYDELSKEATGEYILFCGVDTKFSSTAITGLVALTLQDKLTMLSVLPRRLSVQSAAAIIQPMRYWWELALPRWAFGTPPVLSTCWLVNRTRLGNIGGFSSVTRTILPERYFARLFVRNKAYQFIIANDSIDVQTTKPISEQSDTALRIRYPQVHKRLELVLLVSLCEAIFLLGPFLTLVDAVVNHGSNILNSATAVGFLIATHILVVAVSNPANVPLAMINLPVVIMTEIYLGLESMLKYEFSIVTWKDRNICLPVMHVYPRLPRLHE